ncbi:regulatory protein RecX [Myroides injenensis]|uniref:regulatory protein RecX n=1 Tax=Myroides injenensis TaxID=1183151 RepID=UPI0002891605|nr:regulatory protein RecX [Myroides injenensis]
MEQNKNTILTLNQAKSKLEHYCAYQDRCHAEVINKLYNLKIPTDEHDAIIVHLIEHNFLNEERFARSYSRGKHRISGWGKNRIIAELKSRKISDYLIKKALEELTDDLYFETLDKIAEQKWHSLDSLDIYQKEQKFISYLQRKGYEMEYIFDKIKELKKT